LPHLLTRHSTPCPSSPERRGEAEILQAGVGEHAGGAGHHVPPGHRGGGGEPAQAVRGQGVGEGMGAIQEAGGVQAQTR
jgi:hypothetical protein